MTTRAKVTNGFRAIGFWDWILRLLMLIILPWAVWTTSTIYANTQSIALVMQGRFTTSDGKDLEIRISSVENDLRRCAARTEIEMRGINQKLSEIKDTIDRVHPRRSN